MENVAESTLQPLGMKKRDREERKEKASKTPVC
jgi:hypothetical protein